MVDHLGMQKVVYNTAVLYQMNVQKHAMFVLVSKHLDHHFTFDDKYSCFLPSIFLCSTRIPNFYPVSLQHSSCKNVFSIRLESSVDPDQMIGQKPHYIVFKTK